MEDNVVKNSVEIAKNCFEIFGFLLVGLYFFYRLLAGFFLPCRLGVELACDNPFNDKTLVRVSIKLKNTGPAAVRIKEAWLWVFTFGDNDSTKMQRWPSREEWNNEERRPRRRQCEKHLCTQDLDFQRLSVDRDTGDLREYEADESRAFINLETAGEQQRHFLFKLPPGLYKLEFRIVGTPMFGRWFGFTRDISYPLFPLSRASQWVATAVVEAPSP